MRVAVTVEQCWHEVPGGTARAALEQLRAIGAQHPDIELRGVSARHAGPPRPSYEIPVPVDQLPLPRLALYEAWHRLGHPGVERATGHVDVVHATGFAIPPRTAPLVVSMHDLAVLRDPSHFTRRGVSFLRRSIELTKRRADLVLCPSEVTVHECIDEGFDPDRIRLVPLGVHVRPVTPADVARVREAYELPPRFVLFLGTLEPRKNLRGLLQAFAAVAGHPDVPLVLAGQVGWGDALDLSGLGDRVRPIGFVAPGDLDALYAAATVFAFPSHLEGFGLPVLEAMAQGTPVVTSAGTSTEEIAGGGSGLLIDPSDPDDIASAVQRLLDDEALAASIGATGRARAQTFTWDRTADLTVSAYREVG